MQCNKIINFGSSEETDDLRVPLDIIDFSFNCAWTNMPPSPIVFSFYAFIIPTLACFGFCANFINAIVFMRPKMTPSAFTYLAALAWMDCLSCLLITLTAFSRSVFFGNNFWLAYDFQWQTALFGITTGAANLILACVSVDRLIYLWSGSPNGAPRFCRRKVARCMNCVVVVFSILVNLPYFFIFIVNEDGSFQTTPFFHSRYYRFHNWLTFILLALVPAILLLIGNAAIVMAFRRWAKQRKLCKKSGARCTKDAKGKSLPSEGRRYMHQTKLTITIIIVIMLYLCGELPSHLTSRKSALNLLFGGDVSRIDFNDMLSYEIIFMTLNVMQLSMNIIVYAVINPCFVPEVFLCLRGVSDVCFHCICTARLTKNWQRRKSGESAAKCGREKSKDHCGMQRESCDWRHNNLSQRSRRCDINSWGDVINESDRIDICHLDGVQLRKHSIFIISERVENWWDFNESNYCHSLKADWVWKRSSSFADSSEYSYAMSKEKLAIPKIVEHSENDCTIIKRHSLCT